MQEIKADPELQVRSYLRVIQNDNSTSNFKFINLNLNTYRKSANSKAKKLRTWNLRPVFSLALTFSNSTSLNVIVFVEQLLAEKMKLSEDKSDVANLIIMGGIS